MVTADIEKANTCLKLCRQRQTLAFSCFGKWLLTCGTIMSTRNIQIRQRDIIGKSRHPKLTCHFHFFVITIHFGQNIDRNRTKDH